MCDYDPPIDNSYNPEYPLESDDELDDNAESAESIQTNDLVTRSESPCITAGNPEPVPAAAPYTDVICVKTYTPKDLYPTEPDPDCYPPAWALAFYWPVYVGNFRLNSLDESERNAQISTYFATKGLLTRMIYLREEEDEFFRIHQKRSLLVDMLVYFTSQEDAERAIRCCHRTAYYGHKLNMFSGRVPEYFHPQRTFRFKIQTKFSVEWTETPTELDFYRRGCVNVETIVKHSAGELIVEFGNFRTVKLAVMLLGKGNLSNLTGPVRKQRYLEQDFQIELMWKIQLKSSFMLMVPPEEVLQHLLSGKLPPVERDWENYNTPRELPPPVGSRIDNNRKRKLVENDQIGKDPIAGSNNPGKGPVKKCKPQVRRTRTERLNKDYRLRKEEFSRIKSELLNQNRKKTLAVRNKLFYDLLNVERQLGKVIAELGNEQEWEILKKGLTTALHVANEPRTFPAYPRHVKFSDEQEPLDKLWPVYMGNFRVCDLDAKPRNLQIIDFFAAKGLTVEMIYVGDSDPFYNSYLKQIKLLDMLVYFDSKEVADKAVATYHSTMYRDSKLSVFSGREADDYFSCRTVFLELDPDPTVGEKQIEAILPYTSPEALDSLARLPGKAVFNFFSKTVPKTLIATGLPLSVLRPPIPKQRFLESDVKDDLRRRILYDAEFLNEQPKADALRNLFVVQAMPSDPSGEVVWAGGFRKRKEFNTRIGRVLDEWQKLQ